MPAPLDKPPKPREASSFFREYLIYLSDVGIETVSLQRNIYEIMDWRLSTILPFHKLTQRSLQQLLIGHNAHPFQLLADQFESLRYLMQKLGEQNEEEEDDEKKNFLIMSDESEDLIWAFAPWQASYL
jgi:hypothetical protein